MPLLLTLLERPRNRKVTRPTVKWLQLNNLTSPRHLSLLGRRLGIMNIFLARVHLNFADGTPDDESHRRAVRFLELYADEAAANKMQQLLSETLQWRTNKLLAELDPAGGLELTSDPLPTVFRLD